jgi:two-component system, NtrC family, sensor kinase
MALSQDDRRFQLHGSLDAAAARAGLRARARLRHLAKPVKEAVQSAIDRAFYRDRYDYRRALVAFARDLNSDLGLNRLTAVAGQAGTAIENGRLYRQLHLKVSELDRLRTFNENILESLDDGLLVVGLDDRVIRWNQALEQMYGFRRANALGQPLDRLFDAPFVEAIRAARTQSPQGTSLFRVPIKARTAAGSSVLVNVTMVPLQAVVGAGAQAGTIIILEDITGRAALEEQLRISEKMASLGLLAAGVAHEVNTLLTGISSFTQMLLHQADPHDPRTKVLETIEKQTFRAARIVNGLLTLSRRKCG